MNQNADFANIIGVKILYFKVVHRYRRLKNFMLYFFDDGVFSALENKNVTCAKVNSARPSLLWNIEWVFRCSYNFFTVYAHINKFLTLTNKCLYNFFLSYFIGVDILCPNQIPCFNILYCLFAERSQNSCSGNKARTRRILDCPAGIHICSHRSRIVQTTGYRFAGFSANSASCHVVSP